MKLAYRYGGSTGQTLELETSDDLVVVAVDQREHFRALVRHRADFLSEGRIARTGNDDGQIVFYETGKRFEHEIGSARFAERSDEQGERPLDVEIEPELAQHGALRARLAPRILGVVAGFEYGVRRRIVRGVIEAIFDAERRFGKGRERARR